MQSLNVIYMYLWRKLCCLHIHLHCIYINVKLLYIFLTEIAEGSTTATDIKVWDQRHIRLVACKIKELLNKAREKAQLKKMSLVKRVCCCEAFQNMFTLPFTWTFECKYLCKLVIDFLQILNFIDSWTWSECDWVLFVFEFV